MGSRGNEAMIRLSDERQEAPTDLHMQECLVGNISSSVFSTLPRAYDLISLFQTDRKWFPNVTSSFFMHTFNGNPIIMTFMIKILI